MKKIIFTTVFALLAILTNAQQQIIVLQNGDTLRGKIVEQDKMYTTIETEAATLQTPTSNIKYPISIYSKYYNKTPEIQMRKAANNLLASALFSVAAGGLAYAAVKSEDPKALFISAGVSGLLSTIFYFSAIGNLSTRNINPDATK